MGRTNAVFGFSEYLFLCRSLFITFEANSITFRGIKSGPVAFLGFLCLKPYLTVETTAQDKKGA